MRTRLAWCAALVLALPAADAAAPTELGAPPLCEASAVLRAPWAPARVLVADNEVNDQLFVFDLADGRLVHPRALAISGKKEGVHDIEALAAFGDKLVVVGSHSRNKQGEARPKRARIALYPPPGTGDTLQGPAILDGAAVLRETAKGRDACLAALFVAPAPARAAEVCAALSGATAAVNVEGAVALAAAPAATGVPAGPGTPLAPAARTASPPRLWLGLRSPLAEGCAILLRLADPPRAFRFDAAALVDLGGRGVRDLAVDDTQVYVLAGGPGDDGPPSRLVRLPRGALVPGARLVPGDDGVPVPDHAEGVLPLAANEALLVIDVDGCSTAARQLRVVLP